jgi:hypothetical protein
MEFDDTHVEAAIRYVERFAEDRAQTVSYTRVFEAAGLPTPQNLHLEGEHSAVGRFMEAFHFRCIDDGLPPLDALVVHVDGDRKGWPGKGYFRVNKLADPLAERGRVEDGLRATQFWNDQKAACERWGKERRRARTRP